MKAAPGPDVDCCHARLVQELLVRGSVAAAVLVFDRVFDVARF